MYDKIIGVAFAIAAVNFVVGEDTPEIWLYFLEMLLIIIVMVGRNA